MLGQMFPARLIRALERLKAATRSKAERSSARARGAARWRSNKGFDPTGLEHTFDRELVGRVGVSRRVNPGVRHA